MSSLLFAESFDVCTAAQLITGRWNYSGTSGPGGIVAGRTGNGWQAPVGGSIYKTFTQGLQSTITFGYASNAGGSEKPLVMQLRGVISNGISLIFQNTGDGRVFAQLNCSSGSANGAQSAWTQSAGIWYYIECQATMTPGLNGGGTLSTISVAYTLKINGTTILSGTLTGTLNGVYDPTLIKWSHVIPIDGATIDDVYITDTEFLGDIAVFPQFPASDSTPLQWTPLGGGTHFSKVNEHTPDDDTSYVSDDGSVLNHIDLYGLDQITTIPTPGIKGVQLSIRVKNDVAGSSTVVDELKSGGTTHDGIAINLSDSTYVYSLDQYRKSPFTTADWTVAEVNAMTVGIKRTA